MRIARVAALALLAACTSPRSAASRDASPTRWVVIAPHPDDEALIAGGVLRRATEAGESVAVIVLTNGDFDCVHDGLARQRESITGLAALGVPEDRVRFLGYPDGALARLGSSPLAVRRITRGTCSEGDTTYGDGGRAARYTRASAVASLAAVLGELRPEHVVVTHPEDTHPDHAAAYALLRDALDTLPQAPRVHRAMVHNGDCWPTGTAPHEPCPPAVLSVHAPTPPLSGRLTGYEARERLPVPASCLVEDRARNPKVRAIAAHASQSRRRDDSYLFAFARSDEAFYPESYERRGDRWLRAPASLAASRVELAGGERLSVPHGLPLSITARLAPGARVVFLQDASGDYALEIDAREARLTRTFDPRPAVTLHAWPLPHDLLGPETYELDVDARPEDGAVAELTLRCRGHMVGVAIDLDPRTRGERVAISASPSARPAP